MFNLSLRSKFKKKFLDRLQEQIYKTEIDILLQKKFRNEARERINIWGKEIISNNQEIGLIEDKTKYENRIQIKESEKRNKELNELMEKQQKQIDDSEKIEDSANKTIKEIKVKIDYFKNNF
jgi:hypothetical protein